MVLIVRTSSISGISSCFATQTFSYPPLFLFNLLFVSGIDFFVCRFLELFNWFFLPYLLSQMWPMQLHRFFQRGSNFVVFRDQDSNIGGKNCLFDFFFENLLLDQQIHYIYSSFQIGCFITNSWLRHWLSNIKENYNSFLKKKRWYGWKRNEEEKRFFRSFLPSI